MQHFTDNLLEQTLLKTDRSDTDNRQNCVELPCLEKPTDKSDTDNRQNCVELPCLEKPTSRFVLFGVQHSSSVGFL